MKYEELLTASVVVKMTNCVHAESALAFKNEVWTFLTQPEENLQI